MPAFVRAAGLASLLFAAHANADALPLQITWEAPSECPSGAGIQHEVERVTRPRRGRVLTPLVATATIVHQADLYRLTLITDHGGEHHETRLQNPTCEPLLRAAALVLALAYGDGVEIATTPNSPASSAQPPPDGPTDTSIEPAQRSRVPPIDPTPTYVGAAPRTLELAPWVSALATSGATGRFASGVEAGLMLGVSRLLANLRGAAVPATEAARRDGVSARLSSVSGALGACAQITLASPRVAACTRFELSVLHASSAGARIDGSASPIQVGLAPSLLVRAPLTRSVSLRTELSLLVPLASARFEVAGEGTLYQTAVVIPAVGFGLDLTL